MHVVGIDGHKKTHTLVAVDPLGRRAGEVTVAATPAGHAQAIKWIAQFGQVLLAIEDCRHLTRRFEADLLLAGHAVVRVHTRLMAGARRSARERGKSDPIDAEAVARVALREPDLPRASLAGPARDVKLLADHRRRLVRNRTAAANKLRWFRTRSTLNCPSLPGAYDGCVCSTRWLRRSQTTRASLSRSHATWSASAAV